MVTKKQKNQMIEYLLLCLETAHPKARADSIEIVDGIKTNIIRVDSKGLVLLVDRIYPNDSFPLLYRILKDKNESVAAVFFKDRVNFFRSAAKKNYFGKKIRKSLQNYNDKDLQRMILLRPEEEFLFGRGNELQYYQPKSEKLEESLVTYQYSNVTYDYSHIPENERFTPVNKDSDKLYIWDKVSRENTDLFLSKDTLMAV